MRHARRGSFLLALAIAGLMALPLALSAQCNQNCPEKRVISVNASGSVTVDADLAVVHVGYKLYGADAKSAYASATATSNAVMDSLTGLGIAKDAIESTSQALQHAQPYEVQQYPLKSAEREQHQFVVGQQWTVRVKPDQAAKALDAAIAAGANESGWIEWIVQDQTRAQAEASAKAMANARTIAAQIAQTAGVHLGALQTVNENQQNVGMGVGMGGRVLLAGAAAQPAEPLAINSRRVEFKSTIFASFAIE